MPYQQGEIVMANWQLPSGVTPHPFVILSTDNVRDFDQGYVVAMLTSALWNDEFSFLLEDSMLSKPLLKTSEIRCHLIGFLEEKFITKPISIIHQPTFDEVINNILKVVLGVELDQ